MHTFLSLLTIGFAFFIVAISPGPANLSNASIAMSQGRVISLIYSAGLSAGLFLWGLVAASGLGALLQTSVYLLTLLKTAGGIYLLWLALQSFKSAFRPATATFKHQSVEKRYLRWFVRGFMMNASNPKTVVAWMAALSMGVNANSSASFLVFAIVTCMLKGILVNMAYSLLFSTRSIMNTYSKMARWLDSLAAGIFALAGLGLLSSAFRRTG